MKHLNVLAISATVVVLAMTATADADSVPSWIKGIAGSWADDKISDREFVDAVQFLVDENVIQVDPKIVEIEVIKEVKAEVQEDNHDEIWKILDHLQTEYELTVQRNSNEDVWAKINQMYEEFSEVDDRSYDNKIKIDCEISKLCNQPVTTGPTVDYEAKYDELMQRFIALGERVLKLEKINVAEGN